MKVQGAWPGDVCIRGGVSRLGSCFLLCELKKTQEKTQEDKVCAQEHKVAGICSINALFLDNEEDV